MNKIVKEIYEKQALNMRVEKCKEVHNAIWAFSQTHSMHVEEALENKNLNMQVIP